MQNYGILISDLKPVKTQQNCKNFHELEDLYRNLRINLYKDYGFYYKDCEKDMLDLINAALSQDVNGAIPVKLKYLDSEDDFALVINSNLQFDFAPNQLKQALTNAAIAMFTLKTELARDKVRISMHEHEPAIKKLVNTKLRRQIFKNARLLLDIHLDIGTGTRELHN